MAITAKAVQKKDAMFALAANVANIKYKDIPTQAIDVTKLDILDSLGVALAASSTSPVCKKVVALTTEMGGKKESTIFGFGGKVPSPWAAFTNAALVHALNYDSFYDPLIIHFACSVFPAAFAIAERVGKVNGKDFIAAYTASVDLEARLSKALMTTGKQRDWNIYGWLTTQLFGYFGATAVAGRLLGFDEDKLLSAFGLAYSQVAGNKQFLFGGGADKGMYPSYPAMSGVLSALMAREGIVGPKEILEGGAGLYRVYFQGEYDSEVLTEDLGKNFESAGFYQFPCCGLTHLYIETTMQMVNEHKFRPEDVEGITVSAGPKLKALCEPLEIRRSPRLTTEAQYSLPFIVATTIARGKPGIGNFTADGIKDPEILRISNKINYLPDPECDLQWGTGTTAAKLEIKLKDGRVLRSERRDVRYGHPRKPMSKEEIIEKFTKCAEYSVRPPSKHRIEEVIKMVSNLEQVNDVSEIVPLVS